MISESQLRQKVKSVLENYPKVRLKKKGEFFEGEFKDSDNVYSVSCSIKNFHSKNEEQFLLIAKIMKAVSYGQGSDKNVDLEMSKVLFAWDAIMGIVPDDKLDHSGNKIFWTTSTGTLYKIDNINSLLNALGREMIELTFLKV